MTWAEHLIPEHRSSILLTTDSHRSSRATHQVTASDIFTDSVLSLDAFFRWAGAFEDILQMRDIPKCSVHAAFWDSTKKMIKAMSETWTPRLCVCCSYSGSCTWKFKHSVLACSCLEDIQHTLHAAASQWASVGSGNILVQLWTPRQSHRSPVQTSWKDTVCCESWILKCYISRFDHTSETSVKQRQSNEGNLLSKGVSLMWNLSAALHWTTLIPGLNVLFILDVIENHWWSSNVMVKYSYWYFVSTSAQI